MEIPNPTPDDYQAQLKAMANSDVFLATDVDTRLGYQLGQLGAQAIWNIMRAYTRGTGGTIEIGVAYSVIIASAEEALVRLVESAGSSLDEVPPFFDAFILNMRAVLQARSVAIRRAQSEANNGG